ncbi:MAG: exo-beta-N-acetylmuramidase NamZ domain-containing protein, partial [Bacteroidota bacterium]
IEEDTLRIPKAPTPLPTIKNPVLGIDRLHLFVDSLKGKRIAVVGNQTSVVKGIHLVDTLLSLKLNVVKVFSPEHGFRGKADAGEKVNTYKDSATGIPVISLYGSKLKPSKEDLADIDIMLFDIQDVGVRFYTYISSLQYYMEAAMEYSKHLIVLDRPNPNGHYIDGPVLQPAFKSFVGMQPIPVIYGMTMGEYAQMIIGENWYDPKSYGWNKGSKGDFELTVIPCSNYDHTKYYELPVAPSPNLPNMQSIYLYPSICFFEGTVLSEGRGTDAPFQQFGHPSLPQTLYAFTPQSLPGAKNPKCLNQKCYGWKISGSADEVRMLTENKLQIKWIKEAYELFPDKNNFFLSAKSGKEEDLFFNKLAGNSKFMQQIRNGVSEDQIRASWSNDIEAFKKIRKQYLLYKDFE